VFSAISGATGLMNAGTSNYHELGTYWGGANGDNTSMPFSWHRVEQYYNASTGWFRVWHDGVLVRDDVVGATSASWLPFYLMSNWADPHGPVNQVYFDEVEVYSDLASGATGWMYDATVSSSTTTPNPGTSECSI